LLSGSIGKVNLQGLDLASALFAFSAAATNALGRVLFFSYLSQGVGVIQSAIRSALFLTAATLLAGCGGTTLKPATGTITYNGAPVADASVAFTSEKNPIATGTTDASGTFSLSTNGKPGAPLGAHKVTVTKSTSSMSGMPANPNPADMMKMMEKKGKGGSGALTKPALPLKYGSVQGTDLSAEVTADAAKNVFNFELKD
jgi:hypothetical protein